MKYFVIRGTETYDGYEFSFTLTARGKTAESVEKKAAKQNQRPECTGFGEVKTYSTEISKSEYEIINKYL